MGTPSHEYSGHLTSAPVSSPPLEEGCLEEEGVTETHSFPEEILGKEAQSCQGKSGGGVLRGQRTLCKGACPQGAAPPIPALPHPLVCPNSWPEGFHFQSPARAQLRH